MAAASTPNICVFSLTLESFDKTGALIPPRTKKNSAQLIPKMKRPLLVPSKAFKKWQKGCKASALAHGVMIDTPVNCRALVYRDALRGDLLGFLQAIGDCLQHYGVVADDKWIVSWDGSRLLKDAKRPRVEIVLTEVRL